MFVREAAERHRQSEQLEESFRHRVDADVLRPSVLMEKRQIDRLHAGGADDRESRRVQPRQLTMGKQSRGNPAVEQGRPDVVQILRVGIRQRLHRRRL